MISWLKAADDGLGSIYPARQDAGLLRKYCTHSRRIAKICAISPDPWTALKDIHSKSTPAAKHVKALAEIACADRYLR